jgi:hypothetical protein
MNLTSRMLVVLIRFPRLLVNYGSVCVRQLEGGGMLGWECNCVFVKVCGKTYVWISSKNSALGEIFTYCTRASSGYITLYLREGGPGFLTLCR